MTQDDFYSVIDWQRPWLHSIQDAAALIRERSDWRACLNQAAQQAGLRNHRDLPLHFIAQEDLPEGTAYEAHISATGGVPTRSNLHDYFNALVWLSFPRTKQILNALQAAQIVALGIGKSRGPARDAATIFDENAAILVVAEGQAGDDWIAAWRQHAWSTCLLTQRDWFLQHAELWAFGHALMEKLVAPYKAITTHTRVLRAPATYWQLSHAQRRQWIDGTMCEQLQQAPLLNQDYHPLPVLGVPGWWEGQDSAFYADTQVFRPRRVIAA
ncbi:DUF3025 domain-containing protein [Undibacterium luofuense]|uniref:DUF3025 domain-containing protein n=1 Tax=Undibacterium luofuense TaxID=2828733 RepID=UPI002E366DA7|nr:DUF3025 domain-containing protein [Undibacterium luofuense]